MSANPLHVRRWRTPVVAAALVVVALTAAGIAASAARSTSHVTVAGSEAPTSVPSASASVSTFAERPVADPRATLEQLADHLQAAKSDGRSGRFEYVDVRVVERWMRLPTALDPSPTPPARELTERRIQSWTAAGRGRAVATDLVDGRAVCPPEDQTWHEPGPWDGALGTDPAAVLEQLTGGQPLATLDNPRGMDLFGQLGELAMHRILPQTTRAALLRVVAAQPGIEVRTDVTDQAGRAGVAVTTMIMTPIAVTPLYRTLIFSPTTGELLATEKEFGTSASTAAAAPPRSALPRPGIVLYARAYTADTAAPAVVCGPIPDRTVAP